LTVEEAFSLPSEEEKNNPGPVKVKLRDKLLARLAEKKAAAAAPEKKPPESEEKQMATLHLILVILALVCLFSAAIRVFSPRGTNLTAAGLFLWLLSTLVVGG